MTEITSETNRFYNFSEQEILKVIGSAQEYILYAKPAYFENEAEALIAAAKKGVYCTLYCDSGEDAIRAGYGDAEALKMLVETKPGMKHIHGVERVRLGILIVDTVTIVFAPTLKAFGNDQVSKFPNAIVCGVDLSASIRKLLDAPNVDHMMFAETENNKIKEVLDKYNSMEKIDMDDFFAKQEISHTIESLKANPPIKAEKLRVIDVYRNKYKLMKFTKIGIDISSKVLSLNGFYNKGGKRPINAKNSWQVIPKNIADKLANMKEFQIDIDNKLESYEDKKILFDAGRHGWLVSTDSIDKIKTDIQGLIQKYKKVIDDPEKSEIGEAVNVGKKALIEYLSAYCLSNYSAYSKVVEETVGFLIDGERTEANVRKLAEGYVRYYISKELKYPTAVEIVEKINVKYDFYDVSNELLEDKDFAKILDDNEIKPRDYDKAYEKIKA